MDRLTKEEILNFPNTPYGRAIGKQLASQVVQELLGYKQLEEQIGCPLDVVLKALTNGFKFIVSSHKLGTQNQIVNQMIYCDYAYLYYANDLNAWCISTINDYFYLKDYKKTWFLKETKED